jgi:hypothetical protein
MEKCQKAERGLRENEEKKRSSVGRLSTNQSQNISLHYYDAIHKLKFSRSHE